MKKIIFSLLAVALMVTSCDKDAVDGGDYSSINVAQEAAEIGASVDVDYSSFIDGLAGSITKEEIAAYKISKRTQRVGAVDTQWLHVLFFTFGPNSIPLAYLRSDDTDEVCPGESQTSVLYTLETASSGATRLKIEVGTQEATYSTIGSSLRDNYNTLFGQTLNRLSRATVSNGFALGSVPSLSALSSGGVSFVCAPSEAAQWTGDADGLWTNTDFGSYRITPAPFPLVGSLATVVTEVTGVTGTLNYAASTVGAVRDAIEGSAVGGFGDGN